MSPTMIYTLERPDEASADIEVQFSAPEIAIEWVTPAVTLTPDEESALTAWLDRNFDPSAHYDEEDDDGIARF